MTRVEARPQEAIRQVRGSVWLARAVSAVVGVKWVSGGPVREKHAALGARVGHGLQHACFHLEVPRVVDVAGLEDRASRGRRESGGPRQGYGFRSLESIDNRETPRVPTLRMEVLRDRVTAPDGALE